MMILPQKVSALPIKGSLIISPLTAVEHPIFGPMSLLEELGNLEGIICIFSYLRYGIPVLALDHPTRWIRHCYDPRSNISDVQIILSVLKAASLTAHHLAKEVHYFNYAYVN